MRSRPKVRARGPWAEVERPKRGELRVPLGGERLTLLRMFSA